MAWMFVADQGLTLAFVMLAGGKHHVHSGCVHSPPSVGCHADLLDAPAPYWDIPGLR